ncbi:hypothetical protein Scep_002435 [Stephania cephalantha]|uniref:Uncharacterized protein n=1 Tax=Stephania cephalantha TaxID=152367 RepID=A0AAP0Q5Y2_9MAGN
MGYKIIFLPLISRGVKELRISASILELISFGPLSPIGFFLEKSFFQFLSL